LKQVTEELSALGPIQECNVFNWFQNKKARLNKREQDARGKEWKRNESESGPYTRTHKWELE